METNKGAQQGLLKQNQKSPTVTPRLSFPTSPMSYPDDLEATTSHDDFSSIPSQLSMTSLSVSQFTHDSDSETRLRSGGNTSTATDISEWEDQAEVTVGVEDKSKGNTEEQERRNGEDREDERLKQITEETITNVVWKRSIMFGPIDSTDNDSDVESNSSCSNSSRPSSEIQIDQSTTTTTTTSYITVLTAEEQKDEDISDTKSTTETVLPQHGAEGNSFQDVAGQLKGNDIEGEREPPISSMLSDALEDIERAGLSDEELSREEHELGVPIQDTELTDMQNEGPYRTPLVDSTSVKGLVILSTSKSVTEANTDKIAQHKLNAYSEQSVNEDDNGRINIDCLCPSSSDHNKAPTIIYPDRKSGPAPSIVITKVKGRGISPLSAEADATSLPARESSSCSGDPGSLSSSSGDLLQSNSRDDMLTLSDVSLDLTTAVLRDQLSDKSGSEQSLSEEDRVWEFPGDAVCIEKNLAFLLDKMNQLRHNQKLIMHELKKIEQGSESEASKCKEVIDSMKKQMEKDKAKSKQEAKNQRDRVQLVESAVVELGRHYTGQYQPLLGVRPKRRSSVSHHQAEKLKNFFGVQPPLLHQFLQDLGYEEYIPRFQNEKIGILELHHLKEQDLINLGLPLGPRLRILHEARQL